MNGAITGRRSPTTTPCSNSPRISPRRTWIAVACTPTEADYPAALAEFDRAIELQPSLVEAYLQRGNAWYEIGDHVGAVEDFSTALRLEPKVVGPHLGRANALRDSDHPEQALADYGEAIRLAPDNADAWFQRAIAQHRLDQFVAERTDWTTAIRLDPDLFWLYGAIYRHGHLYEELRSDHRIALRHEPDGAKAYFNRGEAHRYRGRYCAAIRDFTRALDLRPGYDEALLGRGIWYALGADDGAIADLSQVLQRNPNLVEAYFYRGLAYRAEGNEQRARADFGSAHRLSPLNPVILAPPGTGASP